MVDRDLRGHEARQRALNEMEGHLSFVRGNRWFIMFSLLIVLSVPWFVHGAGEADPTTLLQEIGKVIFGEGNPPKLETVIGNLIKWALGFVGIIFLALALYAGFLWMTAQGEAEKVEKARDILIQATVGVVIIALAYAITFAVTEGIKGALN